MSDRADQLAWEARELWGHVPASEQPGDDEEGLMRPHSEHLEMVYLRGDFTEAWRLVGWGEREGLAASRTTLCHDPLSLRVTMWRDGEQLGDGTVPGVLPDLN